MSPRGKTANKSDISAKILLLTAAFLLSLLTLSNTINTLAGGFFTVILCLYTMGQMDREILEKGALDVRK